MNWLQKIINWFKPKKRAEPQVEVPVPTPNPIPNLPPVEKLLPFYLTALNEIGQKEIKGNAHNKRILEYHAATDLKASTDEVAWCSAFVNWCFKRHQIKGTNKANARSWLDWGNVVTTPKRGDVVIFWRNSKDSWEGHVAFFVEESKDYITVLGGNQSNEVSIDQYPRKQLLGYRRLNAV